jgi:hypothetical protein
VFHSPSRYPFNRMHALVDRFRERNGAPDGQGLSQLGDDHLDACAAQPQSNARGKVAASPQKNQSGVIAGHEAMK